MKRYYFLLFALFLINVAAKAQTSSVIVFSQDGEKFWLIINGVRQNDKPETNVKVTGLEAPNYKMKVIFDDEKIPAIDQNLYLRGGDNFDKPMDLSYVIKRNNKGKMVMRGNSWEEAKADPVPVKDQSVIAFHTTENPKTTAATPSPETTTTTKVVTTQTTNTNTAQPAQTTGNTGINVNVGAPGVNMNVNIQDPGVQENMNINTQVTGTTTTTTTTKTTTTHSSGTFPAQSETNPVAPAPATPETKKCTLPMASNDFSSARASIEKQSFSDSKMKTAQQVAKNNCLSTAQVREIMRLFSFEGDKLAFAKYAYDFTTDTNKYFMVNDEFKFSSSADELNSFLDGK